MKNPILSWVIIAMASFLSLQEINIKAIQRFHYEKELNQHSFRKIITDSKSETILKQDAPNEAWRQDFLATRDPILGFPPKERLIPIFQYVDQMKNVSTYGAPGSASDPWVERGPDNVGGRTRALMYDPTDTLNRKVWAGSVGGGLWYIDNINSSTKSWNEVNGFWDNIAISCMSYDPNDSNIFYVGTGEGWYNSDNQKGLGIWKSTDAGLTWAHLSSTDSFSFVNDIVIRNENGTSAIYAAVDGSWSAGSYHNNGYEGLQRSTDGGLTWTQVLPNIPSTSKNYVVADLDISANNTLWAGTKNNPDNTLSNQGGGRILKSSNGTTWSVEYSESISSGFGRVAIACAPSDSNTVYALIEEGYAAEAIVRTTNGGSNWVVRNEPADADLGIPNTDFTRGQAWYDLVIEVDPNNANKVIVGGVDLFRSTDGCNTWTQISKWSNNNNLANLPCSYVHADQHAIVFKPGNSNQVIFGTDGGVFWTNNINASGTSSNIQSRIKDYNVTQFYACAINPASGSNQFLAGAQDNGTQRFTNQGVNSTSEVRGGDGAYCFIDQDASNYQIASYVRNNYYRSNDSGQTFPTTLSNSSTGLFINPADYDDNLNILYSARDTFSIQRITNVTTFPSANQLLISGLTSVATHLRVSPYTTNSTTLFIGTGAGEVLKVTNANATPSVSNITGSNFPIGSVSCIEIGSSENELIVTFSNYGVNSVWYSGNGGTSWTSKEGLLPDMPIRWALFNPNNYNEVLLATEVGVWHTNNFNANPPTWNASNNGMAHTRVTMFQYRASDDEIIASTHGRGLFSSSGFSAGTPQSDFNVQYSTSCASDTFLFNDQSTNSPTSWYWSFSPSNPTYLNGTDSTSQNPIVMLNSPGSYSISLIAENSNGSDTITKSNYVNVLPLTNSQINISRTDTITCEGGVYEFIANSTGAGNSPLFEWAINGVVTGDTGSVFSTSNISNGDSISCYLSSSSQCSSPLQMWSSTIQMNLGSIPPSPVINISGNTLNVNLTGYSYQWYLNSNIIPGATGQSLLISSNGTYSAEIKDLSFGCSAMSNDFVVANFSLEENNIAKFDVYPNPTNGWVTLNYKAKKGAYTSIHLFDSSGRELQSEDLGNLIEYSKEIDLSKYPKGVYFLKIQSGEDILQRKLIIQ